MNDLELLLSAAAADVAWPPTPDLAGGVQRRLRAVPAGPRRIHAAPRRLRRPLLVALAALLLLAGGAMAVAPVREPILDFLGLRSGVKVERVPRIPLPPQPGATLDLGRPSTLAAARARLAFTPLLPSGLGKPAVWISSDAPGGQLGLVYKQGAVFMTEVKGLVRREFARKFVVPGTGVSAVRVNGQRGLWFSGVHEFVYEDASGAIRPETARLAKHTLVWIHDDVLLRLEGVQDEATALRIARSAREAP